VDVPARFVHRTSHVVAGIWYLLQPVGLLPVLPVRAGDDDLDEDLILVGCSGIGLS